MEVELRHLRYFVAVAEELNFTRAAARLHIAQPPLSRAMQELEREIDCQLLCRTTRKVELTPAGRAFLEDAYEVLARADRALDRMRQHREGYTGALTVGLSAGSHVWALPRFVTPFQRAHPSVEVHTRDLTSADQLGLLRTGELDVGFVREPFDQEGLCVTPVHRQVLRVALPNLHPLAGRAVVRLEELAGETIVAFSRNLAPGLHDHLRMICQAARVELAPNDELTNLSALLGVLACTTDPTLVGVDDGLLLPEELGVAFARLEGDPLVMVTAYVRRKHHHSRLAAVFEDFMRGAVRRELV